jgi:hypothetical protein
MPIDRDFEALLHHVITSYAGYPDKTVGRTEELAGLTESFRSRITGLSEPAETLIACREWLAFFRDRHLGIQLADDPEHPERMSFDDRRNELQLTVIAADALLLRIPTFAISLQEPMDVLLKTHWRELISRRTLIVDLRGNGGGTDAVYHGLVPLLYTQPIQQIGCDYRASVENAEFLRGFALDPRLALEWRDSLREMADRMDTAPGAFVPGVPDQTITMEEVLPQPERIGIMIDGKCASAAEEFLLLARQSRKVTLFGTNTSGCLDYSNVRPVPLPSGRFLLKVPISRSRRLPDDPVDRAGIGPDVPIPTSEDDPVGFVLGRLRL